MDYNYFWGITLLLLSCTIYYTVSASETKFITDHSTHLRVNQGDIVRLIAPGGLGASELPPMISYVQSLGLTPNVTENIYQADLLGYSNTDEFRLNDLISALTDDSKVVWCIRGGRSPSRLIPLLEQRLPLTLTHKIIIGQSAITVLHLYLQQKYGWQTIHGSNLDYVGIGFYDGSEEAQASLVALTDLIFDRQESICLPSMTRIDDRPSVEEIESRIVGGNLELVETSIGTFWQVDTRARILFLEDASRPAWRIEMSLDHMKLAGVFDNAEAVVFGDFTGADNDTFVELVFQRFAQSVSFPVFKLSGIGHGNINYPLPLLAPAQITKIDGLNTFRLCVNNINGEIVNSSGSISKFLSRFNIQFCIFIGMVGSFTFHVIK